MIIIGFFIGFFVVVAVVITREAVHALWQVGHPIRLQPPISGAWYQRLFSVEPIDRREARAAPHMDRAGAGVIRERLGRGGFRILAE